MDMLIIVITSLICLVLYGYTTFQRWRSFKLPPGPKPWPIVGNLYTKKPILFGSLNEWCQTYGPIMSVWYGSNLNVVVSSSELAKQVLKEHDHVLADRYKTREQAKYQGAGEDLIWADYGPHYVKVKKMSTLELFGAKRVDALKPIREDECAAMIQSIYDNYCSTNYDEKKGLVLRKYLVGVALNNITRLVFGKRFVKENGKVEEQAVEFKGIVDTGRKLIMSNFMAEHIPWLRWVLPSKDEEFKKLRIRRDRLTTQIMEERLESGTIKQHFVDALLGLKHDYDLTDDTIIGLLWNMIVAGMDTTAIAVEWAMAELLMNPTALEKAQEELDKVIGRERVMTEDDISSLPYLQAIVKEAMRLHAPTPLMLPHRAREHVKIGGYDLPKGTIIHVNVWAIGRDPNIWTDPIQFRPERFLEDNIDIKGSDFRVIPFGSGRRVCIGAQLGMKLVTSMLGYLLHQFKWSLPNEKEKISMLENDSIFVTYMATPLKAHATPRLSPSLYKRVPTDM